MVGGLTGSADGSILSNNYATGNVITYSDSSSLNGSSQSYSGGLIGTASESTISSNYATGNVTDNSVDENYAGGIVGSAFESTISSNYATGDITIISGYDTYTGGLIGTTDQQTNLADNYFDLETSGIPANQGVGNTIDAEGVSGKTTAEMQQQNTFVGWDFNTIWTMREDSYPVFNW